VDLRQLEILRAIVETGSFTAAGARLQVSQSAISRQILLLEEELNEPVFIRFGRRVEITPAGDALLKRSQRMFADIRETRARILDRQRVLTGRLNLAGGMTVCLYLFPRLLNEFRKHHPKVDVQIATGGTVRLLRRLRSGRADLALLTLPVDEGGLTTVLAFREELLLIMPPGHPLGRLPQPRDPAALVGQEFLVFERGSNTRRTLDEFFAREQIKPRVVGETENAEITEGDGRRRARHQHRAVPGHCSRDPRGRSEAARIRGQELVRQTG